MSELIDKIWKKILVYDESCSHHYRANRIYLGVNLLMKLKASHTRLIHTDYTNNDSCKVFGLDVISVHKYDHIAVHHESESE